MQEIEIIIINGGIEDVTLPKGTKVIIKDYDIPDDMVKEMGEDHPNICKDSAGDFYQLMEFENP